MRAGQLILLACLATGAFYASAAPAGDGPAYERDYRRFDALLERFRRGEDSLLDELREAAERMARDHGREDARAVVAHYAGIDAAGRKDGWQAYGDFLVLHERVRKARDKGDWGELRPALLADLRALAERAGVAADFVPAARALSLAARIEVRELEARADLSHGDRRALLARATADARAAAASFERAGQRKPQLEPRWLLGRLALLDGDAAAAREAFERCRRTAVGVRNDNYHQRALLGLVRLAREAGDTAGVDRLLAELATFRSVEECWPLAREHALRLIHEDAAEKAREFLRGTAPLDARERADWSRCVVLADLRLGELEGARARLWTMDEGNGTERLTRAAIELADGNTQRALAELDAFEARDAHERMVASSLRGEALLLDGRCAEALTSLRAALTEADRWEARLADQRVLKGTASSVFGERLGLHTVVLAARALAQLGRPLEAAALGEQYQSRGSRDRRAVTAADLAAWAGRFEHGLVTWVVGADDALCVWVAPDGAAESLAIPRSRRELARGVRRLREALCADDAPHRATLTEQLGRALLPAGLRRRLRTARGGDGRLLALVHGPLERLPLESLTIAGRDLEHLAATLFLPGLPGEAPGAPPAAPAQPWRLLGDPLDSGGRPLLPAAAEELAAVKALHPDALLARAGAFPREALIEALTCGAPVHVATHLRRTSACGDGRLAPVGLVLDGEEMFCAAELLALRTPAPLVVLSACESAEGRFVDAEGLLGLARALLDAGARNLLVTLWPVTDDAAAAFTPLFHEALCEGASPALAARDARRALRAAGRPAADWAAFRLLGRD
ncbi:MAG: CHAT domain-containing protein [Planctomycetota bacterium]|nr:CHAT domain-containing protein [Planctomycetota bacterium]